MFKVNVDHIKKLTLKYNNKQNIDMDDDFQKYITSLCDY